MLDSPLFPFTRETSIQSNDVLALQETSELIFNRYDPPDCAYSRVFISAERFAEFCVISNVSVIAPVTMTYAERDLLVRFSDSVISMQL